MIELIPCQCDMCSCLRPFNCRFIARSCMCLCVCVTVGMWRFSVTLPFAPTRWHPVTLSSLVFCLDSDVGLSLNTHMHRFDVTDGLFSLFPPGCGCVRSPCLLQCVLCSFSPSPYCQMRCCSPSHRATICSGLMDPLFMVLILMATILNTVIKPQLNIFKLS